MEGISSIFQMRILKLRKIKYQVNSYITSKGRSSLVFELSFSRLPLCHKNHLGHFFHKKGSPIGNTESKDNSVLPYAQSNAGEAITYLFQSTAQNPLAL